MAKNIDIPYGWEVKKLGEVCTLEYGQPLTEKNRISGNIPIYSSAGIVGYHNTALVSGPCIVVGRKGSAGSVFLSINDLFCIDTAYYIKTKINVYFLYYVLLRLKLDKIKNNGNVPGLNRNDVYIQSILLPTIDEQKKIADILSLWDKAIQQTKDLIAYKETQKKGLMQNLLTGKKRLHGFNDDWKTIKLGEVAEMNSGGTPTSSKNEYYNGNIYWVSITDMTSSYKYLYDTNIKITELGLKNSSAKIFPANTVLFAMYASIGECIIAKKAMSTSQAILGIRCNNNILYYEYLFYFLYNYKENYKKLAQQGTQANLNKEIVENFKLKIPTSIDEQKAIADILSKADEEINLLNKQLDLYMEQKKGLMQNLLTGKVRV